MRMKKLIKTFFILWFSIGANTHSLTTLKFDTEAECWAAAKAMEQSYNKTSWVSLDMSFVKCIKVEVKE